MEKGNYQHVLQAANHKKGAVEPESEEADKPKEDNDDKEEKAADETKSGEEESDKAQEQ